MKFRDMSLNEREKLVSDKKLCINCLYNNHKVEDCKRNYVCSVDGCKLKHNRYLHIIPTADSSNVVVLSNVYFDRNLNASKIDYDAHHSCYHFLVGRILFRKKSYKKVQS